MKPDEVFLKFVIKTLYVKFICYICPVSSTYLHFYKHEHKEFSTNILIIWENYAMLAM